jgi:hypothetical protein
MKDTLTKVNVAILAMPEVMASALFGMYDLFASVGHFTAWRLLCAQQCLGSA